VGGAGREEQAVSVLTARVVASVLGGCKGQGQPGWSTTGRKRADGFGAVSCAAGDSKQTSSRAAIEAFLLTRALCWCRCRRRSPRPRVRRARSAFHRIRNDQGRRPRQDVANRAFV
jgi:hypothetical protein